MPVGPPTWHVFHVPRAHQAGADAAVLHRNCGNSAIQQPVGQCLQVSCKRGKYSHRLRVAIRPHGDVHLARTYVNTCGGWVYQRPVPKRKALLLSPGALLYLYFLRTHCYLLLLPTMAELCKEKIVL